jgi:hypothetical protein
VRYLLDTCVLSEAVKPLPHAGVVQWLDEQDEDRLYLSVLTIGELEKGISKLADSRRVSKLRSWVENDLRVRFRNRLLPVDLEVAVAWGRLQGTSEKVGLPLPAIDSLIAATALAHHLVVVTRNDLDLERCQVQVFNPWQA